MQRTVFHCVHKEIDNAFSPGNNYSFHESDLQITLRLLSSSLGNTVLLHTLFLEYETQIGQKKKLDNVFQSNCSSHAELLTNLRKIEKRPKIRHKAVMHPALQLISILVITKLASQAVVFRGLILKTTAWEAINKPACAVKIHTY